MRCLERAMEIGLSLSRQSRIAAWMALLASAPLAASASCSPFPLDDFGTAGQPAWRQTYANGTYGYRVAIPPGRVAYGSPPPAPDRGVGIRLGGPPWGYAWVDGSYNVYDGVRSARDYLDMENRPARLGDAPPQTVLALHMRPLRLAGRPGMLQVKRYRCGRDGLARVEHLAVAIRDGVVYTVGLDTTQSADAQDAHVFDALVASWRFLRRD